MSPSFSLSENHDEFVKVSATTHAAKDFEGFGSAKGVTHSPANWVTDGFMRANATTHTPHDIDGLVGMSGATHTPANYVIDGFVRANVSLSEASRNWRHWHIDTYAYLFQLLGMEFKDGIVVGLDGQPVRPRYDHAVIPKTVAKSQPSTLRLLGEQIGGVLIAVSALLAAAGYLKHTSEERVRAHVSREKERMDDFLLPLRYYLSIDDCEAAAEDDLRPLTLSKSAREIACLVKEASALGVNEASEEANLHLRKKLAVKDQFLSESTIALLTKVTALNEKAHKALSALQPRTRRVEFLLRSLETRMKIVDRLTLINYRDEIVDEKYRSELRKEIATILDQSIKEMDAAITMPAAHWKEVVGAPKK